MGKKITGRTDQTRGVTGVTREASAPSGTYVEGLTRGGGGGGGRKDAREMDERGLIYEHPAKIRMTIVRSRTEKASSDDGCESSPQDAKQETNLFPHDRFLVFVRSAFGWTTLISCKFEIPVSQPPFCDLAGHALPEENLKRHGGCWPSERPPPFAPRRRSPYTPTRPAIAEPVTSGNDR